MFHGRSPGGGVKETTPVRSCRITGLPSQSFVGGSLDQDIIGSSSTSCTGTGPRNTSLFEFPGVKVREGVGQRKKEGKGSSVTNHPVTRGIHYKVGYPLFPRITSTRVTGYAPDEGDVLQIETSGRNDSPRGTSGPERPNNTSSPS